MRRLQKRGPKRTSPNWLRGRVRLRERLGLSSISGVEAQQIQAALPTNPEAIRFYYQGLESLQAMDALAGRDLLQRALVAEHSYPLAHAALATAWATLGYDAKARAQAKQALDAADKPSREDHLLVEARYYETVKNWRKAIEAYQVLVSYLPDSPEYALGLANAQSSGGKGKDALTTLAALSRTGTAAKDDPRIDLGISQAASSFGDSKLRRDAAERAAVNAYRQGATLLVARARNQECRALANLGENERAKPVCEEARRIFAEAGDRAGLARALHAMAEVPLNQGDLEVAGNLYRQALAIMKTIPLPARSPNLNAFAERWVHSANEECLSKLILFGEGPYRVRIHSDGTPTHYRLVPGELPSVTVDPLPVSIGEHPQEGENTR